MHKVNLTESFARFHDHWNPRVVAELNGQHVKLVKFQGEFVWHHHDHEVHVLLFEPSGTLNTGNVRDARTVENPERLG